MPLSTLSILLENFQFNEENSNKFLALAVRLGLTLDDFLHGKVHSRVHESNSNYLESEQIQFARDLVTAHERLFAQKAPQLKKEYIVSAGAPGVGKSAFLEHHVVDPFRVYIDSDREVMRFMSGYDRYVKTDGGEKAYNHYRDASRFIANFLIVFAVYNGYSVVHGTTFTDERVSKILAGLKQANYNTTIYVLFADKDSRDKALKHRVENEKFFQITEADAKGKVAPVFDRISDAYLVYADQIIFSYNTGNYWLNRFPKYDSVTLRVFATAKREGDKMLLNWLPKNDEIFEKLMAGMRSEVIPDTKRTELIKKFESAYEEHKEKILVQRRESLNFKLDGLIKNLEPRPLNLALMFSKENVLNGTLTLAAVTGTLLVASKLLSPKPSP